MGLGWDGVLVPFLSVPWPLPALLCCEASITESESIPRLSVCLSFFRSSLVRPLPPSLPRRHSVSCPPHLIARQLLPLSVRSSSSVFTHASAAPSSSFRCHPSLPAVGAPSLPPSPPSPFALVLPSLCSIAMSKFGSSAPPPSSTPTLM
ncbi:hypothetical protein KC19_6G222300 [Ceratodon purpureus]|uniref:Uncharacterized protein n=1 Tax=Ceratodon purpureus TaxID=3225 RepID=A0A8T0HKG0_CERPU|nr:hypothetical protein KC19_6G222300 [Ceratodon purpureus]